MLKRLLTIVLAITCVLTVGFTNKKPVFNEYSSEYEIYLNSNSSNAQIVHLSNQNLFVFNGVYGESFKTQKENFDVSEFLARFNARLIKTERVGDIVCYYAYSPKIKYHAYLSGQVVNLHVAISEQITVGSPLIFGSF